MKIVQPFQYLFDYILDMLIFQYDRCAHLWHCGMIPYKCRVQIIWCVFEDQEDRFLDVEHIVELDQILMICLLEQFDLSQREKGDTVPILQ